MGRIKIISNLLFILILTQNSRQIPRTAVDTLRHQFLAVESEIWSEISEEQNNNVPHTTTSRVTLEKYIAFTEELQKLMPYEINEGLRSLERFRPWISMYSEMRQIFTLYENFRKILTLENGVPSPKEQWIEFSETITRDFSNYKYLKNTLPNIMKNIRRLVAQSNIFNNVLHHVLYDHCEIGQSTDQVLYNLYNSIALIQLKAYVMTQFAFTMLTVNEKGYKISENMQTNHEYENTYKETMEKAKEAMKLANRDLWKCDPKYYVKEETYTELKQLLQGYLENEVDMNPRSNCLQNCAYYDYTKNMGCYRGICKQQRVCKGKILNCKYIDSDMTVCEADKRSGKRYDYIEYDNDRVLGRNTGCSRGTTRVESWWRWLFWHCSYCICLCDDASPQSDRYFSLRPVTSDVKNNMVVTGIRLKKESQIIHLQIQEGKLMPYGRINSSLSKWKSIDNFRITDKYIRDGMDYHMMSYEKRDIDLDDLTVPEEYVVTGVKFRIVGAHLNFEIQATPFNYTTGILIQPTVKSFWHSSDNTLTRSKLQLKDPDLPTRTQLPSQITSKSDMYMEFTNTDLEKDVGQHTVPFIDIQEVSPETLTPLSGAGIYHKGIDNFGGFIAPKIITYNNYNHMYE